MDAAGLRMLIAIAQDTISMHRIAAMGMAQDLSNTSMRLDAARLPLGEIASNDPDRAVREAALNALDAIHRPRRYGR